MQSHPVVALVSSAGGLAATTQILSGLPAAFPGSVIVLQHSRPDRQSLLPQILERHTGRSVTTAQSGSPLTPGAVLVAPSGCHTLVGRDRTLTVIPSGPFPPWRPSADLLLTTMAMALGTSAIAVILSGTSHDGATGATAVHEMGGTVLTSDEETSAYFSMPRSTIERDQIRPPVLAVADIATHLPELLGVVDNVNVLERPDTPHSTVSRGIDRPRV